VPTNRPAIGDLMDFFDFNQAVTARAPARLPKARGAGRAGRLLYIPNALR
jgi:hypothetical protein